MGTLSSPHAALLTPARGLQACRLGTSRPLRMGVGGEHIGLSPVSSPTVTRCDGLLEEVEGIFLQLSHSANSFEYSLHTRHCIRLWGHGSERQMLFLSTHSSPSRGRDRLVRRLHTIVRHITHGKPRTSQGAEKGYLTHSLGRGRGVWEDF